MYGQRSGCSGRTPALAPRRSPPDNDPGSMQLCLPDAVTPSPTGEADRSLIRNHGEPRGPGYGLPRIQHWVVLDVEVLPAEEHPGGGGPGDGGPGLLLDGR